MAEQYSWACSWVRSHAWNGGYVEGKDFLLDIPGTAVSVRRAAEMLVSAMNLLRAGPVTIFSSEVVRRGRHDDR